MSWGVWVLLTLVGLGAGSGSLAQGHPARSETKRGITAQFQGSSGLWALMRVLKLPLTPRALSSLPRQDTLGSGTTASQLGWLCTPASLSLPLVSALPLSNKLPG